jgi:hypothetical protein
MVNLKSTQRPQGHVKRCCTAHEMIISFQTSASVRAPIPPFGLTALVLYSRLSSRFVAVSEATTGGNAGLRLKSVPGLSRHGGVGIVSITPRGRYPPRPYQAARLLPSLLTRLCREFMPVK